MSLIKAITDQVARHSDMQIAKYVFVGMGVITEEEATQIVRVTVADRDVVLHFADVTTVKRDVETITQWLQANPFHYTINGQSFTIPETINVTQPIHPSQP